MSVYKPKNSEVYVYDFWLGGRRFSGSTGETAKRAAQEVEKTLKAKQRRALAEPAPADAPITLEIACEKYWQQAGKFIKRPDQLEWSLTYIMKHLGKDKLISQITDDDVAGLVAKRRGEFVENALARRECARPRRTPKKPPRRVSAATVNRSVLEPLKRVLIRQQADGAPVKQIDWKRHRLKEPKERIRSMSADEQDRLFQHLPAAFHPIIRFAIRTGCRASECCNLKWSDIDWGGRTIRIVGKGGKVAAIPMETRVREILWPLQKTGTEFVFRLPNEQPIVYAYLYSAFLRATRAAGIVDLRIHDLRHTAATRLLKKTGNIKMAMKLLRHEDISTTAKYAAVLDEDLREALDALDEPEVPAKSHEAEVKPLKENGK